MKRSFSVIALVVFTSGWSVATTAHADEADELFAQGTKLAESGDAPEAEVAFEKAWALRKAWDIAGNLGLAEAAQGKWEEAAEHLHYAISHIGSLANPEHKAGLKERYENVIGRVAKVSIQTDAASVVVKVGSRTVSASDPIFLLDGPHQLECSAEGYESTVVNVTATKGQALEVKVELKKISGYVGPGPKAEPKPMWPAILLGVGGGVLVAGGIGSLVGGFAVRGGVEDETLTGQCSTDPACGDHETSLDTANTLGALGLVGMGVGAAALVGMGVYLAVGGDTEAPRVGLTLGPGAVLFQGKF